MAKFIVTTSKGLDELLLEEVKSIAAHTSQLPPENLKLTPGQVSFEAELALGYACCLHSRLANRVLFVLTEGKVTQPEDVYQTASAVDWPAHFSNYVPFVVHFNGTNKVINNSQYGALTIKDAIVDAFIEDEQETSKR